MNRQLIEIREQQRNNWNKFSSGWKKWEFQLNKFFEPISRKIIADLKPSGKDMVLDIATGTGEPGLTIATMLNGGKVIITDVAEDMLAEARENASKRGIGNVEPRVCDVCSLPFANKTFDAISCRFGFMFFPDMQIAANEMARVLKDEGRIAVSVWDIPEKNFWVTATMGTINRLMQLPQPETGTPGMFRCCKPGLMEYLFTTAGFRKITISDVTTLFNSESLENYWSMMTETGAPIATALSQADDTLRLRIKNEVFDLIRTHCPGNISINAGALVISAVK